MNTIHRRAVVVVIGIVIVIVVGAVVIIVVVIVIASILSISIDISDSCSPSCRGCISLSRLNQPMPRLVRRLHPVGRVSRIRPAWLKGMLRSPNGNGAFWTCGASTVSASGHWHTSATISKRMAWLRLQAEARSSGTAVLSQIGTHRLAP